MINTSIEEFAKQFPESNYDKKNYSFSKEEFATLNTYHTIQTMGEMAGVLIDKLINQVCLPRVGYAAKKGMGTIYDQPSGTFTVFVPKMYCELCKDNPATLTYNEKKYCEQCLSLVQIKEQVEKGKDVASDKTIIDAEEVA
jgi:hypothetical protein